MHKIYRKFQYQIKIWVQIFIFFQREVFDVVSFILSSYFTNIYFNEMWMVDFCYFWKNFCLKKYSGMLFLKKWIIWEKNGNFHFFPGASRLRLFVHQNIRKHSVKWTVCGKK